MKPVSDYSSRKISRLSFVLAVLVVFLHSRVAQDGFSTSFFYSIQELVCQGIVRVAVPFFFIISGFLLYRDFSLERGWYIRKLKRRFCGLVVPYFIWSVIGLLFLLLLNFTCRKTACVFDVGSLTWWLHALGISHPPIGAYHLWFLRTLIVAVMLSPLIGLAVSRLGLLVLVLILVMGEWFSVLRDHSFLYVMLGAYLALKEPAVFMKINRNAILGISLSLWIALNAIKVFVVGEMSGWEMSVITLAANLSGIVFLWLGYDTPAVSGCLSRVDAIVKCSFFLYCAHPFFMFPVRFGLSWAVPVEDFPFAFFITTAVVTILSTVAAWRLLERLAPAFRSLLSGGR